MIRFQLVVMFIVGCGGGNPGARPDATATPDAPVATIDATIDAPVGAPAGTHTLFVNTDGVRVTPGGDDDATQNISSLVPSAVTFAPYADGMATRATKIAAIVSDLATILAPYDITIVTARPTSGKYQMIVTTDDTAAKLGAPAEVISVVEGTCGTYDAPISFLFPTAGPDTAHYNSQQIIAMFGLLAGIPMTKQPQDCLCYSDPSCTVPTGLCAIGGANTPVDTTDDACTSGATVDEGAAWLATFGAHP